MWIPVEDTLEYNISSIFEKTNQFIDKCVSSNIGIYIHCHQGISRSVTVVCAYLIKKFKMSAAEALNHIRKTRPIANPNPAFMQALVNYSAITNYSSSY
jgi:protein-tyrosine phosphatase